ncbi:SNF2 family N-terminal domain-containing protein [Podospora appendiculata]|uniref:SNF2 family N-terminal domain-containing protein n=1 Tax=Podospora appendiculata TaxID=314037 RepID=A0AAE0XHJ1_9PEZI|nr:SNF2 family N-terminal domain-containing protein [Podospora appendiculata]
MASPRPRAEPELTPDPPRPRPRPASVNLATTASQPRSHHPDPISADPDLVSQLRDDLTLQRTILASVEDLAETEDTRQQISDIKREIAKTKRRLLEVRQGPPQAGRPRLPSSLAAKPKMEAGHSNTTGDPFQNSYLGPPTAGPSNVSTPSNSSSAGGVPSHFTIPSRKRSFGSTYLEDGFLQWTENKSHRATPSPMNNPFTAPSSFNFDDDKSFDNIALIDLTEDDEVTTRQQREEEERLGRNKAASDQDALFAKQLAEGISPSSNPSPPTRGSQFGHDRAFDRMHGHAFQPRWQPNQRSQPNNNNPRSNSASLNPIAGPGAFGENEHGFASAPSHVANSYLGGPRVKPEPSIPVPQPRYHKMPGGYVSSDSEDDSFWSTWTNYQKDLSGSSLDLYASRLSNNVPGVPRIESARQASMAKQETGQGAMGFGHYTNNNQASPFASYSAITNAFPQGGFDLTGDQPGYFYNGQHYSPAPSEGRNSLSAVINRTSQYDFQAMTDDQGNALDSRLHDYLVDYVNDPRKTDAEIQQLLANIQPDMDIPEEERGETPDALKYPLYPHQQLSLQWMKNMEAGSNKGGILADDMGLGKTISTLALIVSRKSTDDTNLIIGPVALIKQWEHEIKKKLKSSHSLSVCLLHGKKRPYSDFKKYDVVLTTYGSVASEWKKYTTYCERKRNELGTAFDESMDTELAKGCPILHPKSKFYRIILDEAQCIKNKDTQSSKGVHRIIATYRWCLTGTPMMNGVSELFPLIRFLRIKPYCDIKQFTQTFRSLTPKSKALPATRSNEMRQLQAVLKAIMLRRMKNSTLDGKPILTLPAKTEISEHVVFSPDEASFYNDLEARSQVQLNKYLRAGTVGKNYSNILVLLLRLRQACCHPHLMDFECVGANDVSDDQMLALAKELDASAVDRIRLKDAFECPICYDAVQDPTLLIPCGHDTCSECFASLTDNTAEHNLRSGIEGGSAKCPVCRGTVNPSKTINYSIFQKVFMPEKLVQTASDVGELQEPTEEEDSSTDSDSETEFGDHDDNESLGSLEDFIVRDDEANADDDNDGDDGDYDDDGLSLDGDRSAIADVKPKKKKEEEKPVKPKKMKKKATKTKKAKGKAEEVKPHMLKTLRHEAGKNKEARRKYMHFLRDNWEDSAKVTEVIKLLKVIQETDEKTIIFSQWTALLDLIECQVRYKLGLKYCRYTGGMSRNHRDEAVHDFIENSRNKVMLVSLRAGNAGLNLTVASRIIICDPFWNPYIEMQAVDRAHRIGQQREVKVHRILVQETVEDRIIELQQRKRELVDSALDEGESKSLGRLNTAELAYLFGVRGR